MNPAPEPHLISCIIYSQTIIMPHPNIFSPTSNDPQTLRDAVEAGHEEPETPDEGRCQSGEHIQSDFFMPETM